MTKIQMKWAGGLKFTGVGGFGSVITTDAARENGGESSGHKPSELLLFGLAGCTGIDIVRILTKQHQALTSLDIEIIGYTPEDYPKPFHTIEVKYIARGKHLDPNKLAAAIALSGEKYCLVGQSLQQQVKLTTSYEIIPEINESNRPVVGLSRQSSEDCMNEQFAHTLTSRKPFDEVVAALERLTPEHQFRVLHIHDVQATLAEKGLQRGPLKIIEVCNSTFAHEALQKDMDVALFMPCRYSVYTRNDETIVSLGRPSIISQMIPNAGLNDLAAKVENTLKQIMEKAV